MVSSSEHSNILDTKPDLELDKMPVEIERIGIVDLGSNSVRFVVFEIFGGAFFPIYNEKVLAGLGRDLFTTGKLNPKGVELALQALMRFQALAKAQHLPPLLIAATAALRDASDAGEFIDRAYALTGIKITPIEGAEEARLSALGVVALEPRAKGIAADLGGASLELIGIDDKKISTGISYKLGPFSMNAAPENKKGEAFDVPHLRREVLKSLATQDMTFALPDATGGKVLYLIGGAWRNLALIHQAREKHPLRIMQSFQLSVPDVQGLAQWAYGEGRETLLSWRGISSRRADTLPYSGLLLDILIKKLRPAHIVFAPAGLREGMVYNHLSAPSQARNAFLDACRAMAFPYSNSLSFGPLLFEFLLPIMSVLPSYFEPANEARLRKAACLLIGIGQGKHPDHRADIVFDNVLYGPFPELNHEERTYLALMLYSAYTGRNRTPNDAAIDMYLPFDAQKSARAFGLAIRLGTVISARSVDILKYFSLNPNPDKPQEIVLSVEAGQDALLTEIASIRLKKLGQKAGLDTQVVSPYSRDG